MIVNSTAQLQQGYSQDPNYLVQKLGERTFLPDCTRNYPLFNFALVGEIVRHKEKALTPVLNFLTRAQTEQQICEGLYVLDRMIDAKVKGIDRTYPVISRFNEANSPNIQVILAGIYRKTQVPDAFGPLIKMMVKTSIQPPYPFFNPAEEIGGALLEYIRSQNAAKAYHG